MEAIGWELSAKSVQATVPLVGGKRLVALIIKYRVGVQLQEGYDVVGIGKDFFG